MLLNNEIKNIYLAGKIGTDQWRRSIVPGIRGLEQEMGVFGGDVGDLPRSWRVSRGAITINGKHYNYSGPYFISCDHGCYHSAPHAWGYGVCGEVHEARGVVKTLCLEAIRHCDLLFAWIDTTDCYGTIAEIGFARALSKNICIAGPRLFPDMWLTYYLADKIIKSDKPREAIEEYLKPAMSQRATDKQLAYLRRLGCHLSDNLTKGEAGKLIAAHQRRTT